MWWCVIDCDLVCMSVSNNYDIYICEMDGLGVSYIQVTTTITLLFKYRCNTIKSWWHELYKY